MVDSAVAHDFPVESADTQGKTFPGAGRKGTRLACSYPCFVEDDPKVPSCAGPCTFFVEITPDADKPRQVVTQACLEHNHDFHLRAYCRAFLKENEEPGIAERSSLIQEYALSSRLPALKKKFDGHVATQATLADVQPLLDAQEQTFRDIRAYLGADAEKAVKGSAMQKRIFLDKGEVRLAFRISLGLPAHLSSFSAPTADGQQQQQDPLGQDPREQQRHECLS